MRLYTWDVVASLWPSFPSPSLLRKHGYNVRDSWLYLRMTRVREDTCACTVGHRFWPEALNFLHLFPLIYLCTCVVVTINAVDKKSKIMLPNLPQNSLLSTTREHPVSTPAVNCPQQEMLPPVCFPPEGLLTLKHAIVQSMDSIHKGLKTAQHPVLAIHKVKSFSHSVSWWGAK